MLYGYLGKILRVDLNKGIFWDEALPEGYARLFVGGSGLAARYMIGMVDKHTDPLGPDNPLIFMTGPLVGTTMPLSGRFSVCALSPLTHIWGESNCGGFFGPELRFAGYDGMIITGQADQPVFLAIIEGKASLHDARDVWGCDTYLTQERVCQILNEPKGHVACIGIAGEKRVKMASIVTGQGRTAGRTGMGAVMGSKNLKAIVVRGFSDATSKKVPIADTQGLKIATQTVFSKDKEDMVHPAFRLAGTGGYLNMGLMYGGLPIRYYQQGEWEKGENLSGVILSTQYLNRRTGCQRCTIACGRETRAPRFGDEKVDGPEYETLGSLGVLPMVDDLEAVIHSGHLCNRYGMDTISTGSTICLAIEMYTRGILSPADTAGLELRYGDASLIHRLIEMIAHREGIGDTLAEGSAALAERYGVPELAVTVRRLEVPMHDPRAFTGMAVTYALSPRGACHMQGDMYSVDVGQGPAIELGITPGDRLESSLEKGRIAARHQAWRNLYNSLIVCQFENPGVPALLEVIKAVTGWGLGNEELLTLGKRIVTLKRLLNFHLGTHREDDRLPDILMKPHTSGGTGGNVPNVEVLLAGAYSEYGWDPETGKPTQDTIKELGLGDLSV